MSVDFVEEFDLFSLEAGLLLSHTPSGIVLMGFFLSVIFMVSPSGVSMLKFGDIILDSCKVTNVY